MVNNATPSVVYWQANAVDAAGHLTQQTYGNGVVTQQVFDPNTGRLTNQYAGAGNSVQNMSYSYDTLGNLQTRTDVTQNLTETYAYDSLNRLTSATATSGAVNTATTYAYNAIGNLTCKSDISACTGAAPNYAYNTSGAGSVRPHAVAQITGTINGVTNPVYTYDANGNMVGGAGRTTTWTSYNLPAQITRGASYDYFWYNPEHERVREEEISGKYIVSLSPRYDTGIHFEKIVENGAIKYESFLYAGGVQFGQYEQYATTAAPNTITQVKVRYFHKDHLGSTVAITDETGAVLERLSYDPFGKRRYPNGTADPNGLLTSQISEHGYTGHEHLDEVGVIHMNGRIYDPLMARFLPADPIIQAPGNLQSYNRYSYVWNNPLGSSDPSGYRIKWKNVVKVAVVAAAVWYAPVIAQSAFQSSYMALAAGGTVAQAGAAYTAASVIGSAAAGALVGATVGAVTGGTVQSAFQGAKYGAVSGGIFGGIDAQFGNNWNFQRVAANSMGGGFSSAFTGGDFGDGFRQNFFTSSLHLGWEYTKGATDNLKLLACSSGGAKCEYDERGVLRTDGARDVDWSLNPNQEGNWLTSNGMAREGSGLHLYDPGQALESKFIRNFVTDVSKLHDYFNSWSYNTTNGFYMSRGVGFDSIFQLYSFAGMPVAGALTAASYLGESVGQVAVGAYRRAR